MCDSENPDYAVAEWRKKCRIKKDVRKNRAKQKFFRLAEAQEKAALMNDTKWNEIRLTMCAFEATVRWRTKNIETGYVSSWDSEWFYHFSEGGYNCIEWLEIELTADTREKIIAALEKIHVPAEVLDNSVKIYGYKNGSVSYL